MASKYGKKTAGKVEKTMHEFKHGTLKSGSGHKVKSRKQAIAIGLSQARAKGYKVPPASHATKLDREIGDATGMRDGWTKVKVRSDWPETWEKHLRNWWYTVEKRPNGRWSMGYSHRRGDPDSIDRGATFATWEAATKFAEEHAR